MERLMSLCGRSNFNSKMVRLKADAVVKVESLCTHFNSKMVRLKENAS